MLLKLPRLCKGSFIIQTVINECNFSYGGNKLWVADKPLSFGMNHKGIYPYERDKYFAVRIHHEFKSGGKFKVDTLAPAYVIDLSVSIAENVSDNSDTTKTSPCDLTFNQILVYAIYVVGALNYPVRAPFPSILKKRMFDAIGGEQVTKERLLLEKKETEYDPDNKVIKFEKITLL